MNRRVQKREVAGRSNFLPTTLSQSQLVRFRKIRQGVQPLNKSCSSMCRPSHNTVAEPENAHSHLLSMVLGNSESIPITRGKMAIGTWQVSMPYLKEKAIFDC